MRGLQLNNITVQFAGAPTPALDDVSVGVESGRVLAVLGPSGCGKSTLLRVAAGLQPATGRVLFDDEDLTRTPTHRRDFALMFQDGQLFGHLNVAENVGYALKRRKASRQEIADRTRELLEIVGLTGMDQRSVTTLSGGQQQRVALARALAAKPRVVLLDEPLSALDRNLRERLAGEVRDILTSQGTTALFVTHDHDEALSVADDIAIMDAGQVVQIGEARQVWEHPNSPTTARFLGYPNIIEGELARRLGLPDGVWALRRSGFVLSDENHGTPAVIRRVSFGGDELRIDVECCGTTVRTSRLVGAGETSGALAALRPGDAVSLTVVSGAARRVDGAQVVESSNTQGAVN